MDGSALLKVLYESNGITALRYEAAPCPWRPEQTITTGGEP